MNTILPSPLSKIFAALLFAALNSLTPLRAAPFVHPLFTNNMVLQRDTAAPVWGWTTPGAGVTVTVNGQTRSTTASASTGRWQADVGPFPAGGPYTLTVTGPQSVSFTNVMFGDVWLCSGQSNMAYPISNMGNGVPVLNSSQEIADSVNYPRLRFFTVPYANTAAPQSTLPGGTWIVPGSSTTGNLTATGYFFARELYKRLGTVPVGVVCAAVAGTEIKRWIEPGYASTFPDFASTLAAEGSGVSISGLYNGMIAPLAPFAFKGVCWYQGESNRSLSEQYSRLLPALRGQWRTLLGNGTLPFVIIQLPSWGAAGTNMDTSGWANMREAQANAALADSAHSRVVSTIDLGDGDLHPKNKQDVGFRAARAAANAANGQNVACQAPSFDHAVTEGNTIRCFFTNVGPGLMTGVKDAAAPLAPAAPSTGPLGGFFVAGSNGVFASASAGIDAATNTVVASSASVATPVYVRYSWGANLPHNLYGKIVDGSGAVIDGMPVASFRNDPTRILSVNSGSGGGSYALNSAHAITAAAPPAGQIFDRWTGDTWALSNPFSAATSATISQTYTTLLANYRPSAGPALIAPWNSQDIGATGLSGSADMTVSGTSFTVSGAGSDIGAATDSFRFCYKTLAGDGTITARVDSQQASGNTPRAGVMMRQSLTANSPYVFSYVTTANECRYQARYPNGSVGTSSSASGARWIRIVRTGNQFRGYWSGNGVDWTQLGTTVTISAASPIYVGFAVCSRSTGVANTATFGSVVSP